jgi:hypothetical protein
MRKSLYLLTTFFVILTTVLGLKPAFAADDVTTTQEEAETDEVIVDPGTTETVIDDHTTLSENRYFDLTLERGPQTPFGQYVPYTLTVTPHLDSSRTQILWNMPTTLEAYPKHKEFVSLEKDQTYVFEGRIKPLRGGIYDFSISVISWQYDTNYTNSVGDNVVFNDSLVFQPVSSYYNWMNVLKFGLLFVGFAVAIVVTVILVKKYTKKAKKWLTPPSW